MKKQELRTVLTDLTTTQLVEVVFCDVQTGTLNRRAFVEAEARKTLPWAVALVDVDSLKWVNDVLGHAAGDKLLLEVASALQARLGDDNVYRMGGDEFAVRHLHLDTLRGHLELAQLACPKFSYGVGADLAEADYRLNGNKERRLLKGDRAMRGRRPPWA